jgi:hypothetical protein
VLRVDGRNVIAAAVARCSPRSAQNPRAVGGHVNLRSGRDDARNSQCAERFGTDPRQCSRRTVDGHQQLGPQGADIRRGHPSMPGVVGAFGAVVVQFVASDRLAIQLSSCRCPIGPSRSQRIVRCGLWGAFDPGRSPDAERSCRCSLVSASPERHRNGALKPQQISDNVSSKMVLYTRRYAHGQGLGSWR